MSDTPHDPRLNALEAALAALQPAPPQLSRDRLLFEAGRQAARLPGVWRFTTALSSLTAIVLGVLLYLQPEPRVQYVHLPAPTLPPPEEVVRHQPAPADSPAPEEPPRSWLPWPRDWLTQRERLLDEMLTLKSKPVLGNNAPIISLREWLGISHADWKEIHFLGKTRNPIDGGGF